MFIVIVLKSSSLLPFGNKGAVWLGKLGRHLQVIDVQPFHTIDHGVGLVFDKTRRHSSWRRSGDLQAQ